MADNEITYMDLASLLKITPNTPLERLGTALNASIFDASNVAGTLKQKGLIEFTANYPGPNAIIITDVGQALIKEADLRSTDPIDALDQSILDQLSGGKRVPFELQSTLNIMPKDLAIRLYKLNKQGFTVDQLKNGGIDLMLTEKGFLRAKADMEAKASPPEKHGLFGRSFFKMPGAKEASQQQSSPAQKPAMASPAQEQTSQPNPQPQPAPQQSSPMQPSNENMNQQQMPSGQDMQSQQPQQQQPSQQPSPSMGTGNVSGSNTPQPGAKQQGTAASTTPPKLKRPLSVTIRKNSTWIIAAILIILLIAIYLFVP